MQALSTAHSLFLHQAIIPAIPFCLHSSFNLTLEGPEDPWAESCPYEAQSTGEAAGFSLGQMPIQLEVQLALQNLS